MTDDPIDAFDKIADDIRRRQEEQDAADELRSEKAAERRKRESDDAPSASVESPQRPKTD